MRFNGILESKAYSYPLPNKWHNLTLDHPDNDQGEQCHTVMVTKE